METKKAEAFARKMLVHPALKNAPAFVILGLNRDNPAFGDDAVLMDCETGELQFFSGLLKRGTREYKDKKYNMACDEYVENRWTLDDDSPELIDPYEDSAYGEAGRAKEKKERYFVVPEGAGAMIPEGTCSIKPGEELWVSYDTDGETLIADTCRIEMTGFPLGLTFHTNHNMNGIKLDEDFFAYPLICWNTGSRTINVDGQTIPAGGYLILPVDDPQRMGRRRALFVPCLDSSVKIEENEKRLLASGCPKDDARALAVYFWISDPDRGVEDYKPADHAGWMEELRQAERNHPED